MRLNPWPRIEAFVAPDFGFREIAVELGRGAPHGHPVAVGPVRPNREWPEKPRYGQGVDERFQVRHTVTHSRPLPTRLQGRCPRPVLDRKDTAAELCSRPCWTDSKVRKAVRWAKGSDQIR